MNERKGKGKGDVEKCEKWRKKRRNLRVYLRKNRIKEGK